MTLPTPHNFWDGLYLFVLFAGGAGMLLHLLLLIICTACVPPYVDPHLENRLGIQGYKILGLWYRIWKGACLYPGLYTGSRGRRKRGISDFKFSEHLPRWVRFLMALYMINGAITIASLIIFSVFNWGIGYKR